MINCVFENGNKRVLRHAVTAVIVLDKQINKLLLIRRSLTQSTEPGKFALPGGYVDKDETIEEAAIREVKEETGYNVHISSLFRIIDTPIRLNEDKQNIEFTFVAEVVKKVSGHDKEVSEILWTDFDTLPDKKEFAFDHFESIQAYLNYLKNPFNLPIIGPLNK
jgi:8-oxo-dGTP diphosphatase